MHAFQCVLDTFGNRAFHRNRDRDLRGRSGQIVELIKVARVAFRKIIEKQRNLVQPGLEVEFKLLFRFEIAAIGCHPSDFPTVQEKDRTAAGAETNTSCPCLADIEIGAGPGCQTRGTEPETGQIDTRRAERQPPLLCLEGPTHIWSFAAIGFCKDCAARIFVRNEILMFGQEEEGVHFALHRLIDHIKAVFHCRAELPVPHRLTRVQSLAHVVLFCRHFRSATATGATSLYSWFSPVMPQTKP